MCTIETKDRPIISFRNQKVIEEAEYPSVRTIVLQFSNREQEGK